MKNSWKKILENNGAFKLRDKIYQENKPDNIFPQQKKVFYCFDFFELKKTKVVFLGQDPYYSENKAMGLSFSVPNTEKSPPSLKNIFIELKNDLGIIRTDNDLSDLAMQGILFLNCILTVEKNKPNSHKKIGWEKITNEIIKIIDKEVDNVIFILLGKKSYNKKKLIKHSEYVICVPHPSPLSAYRGFFGSKIFSKVNNILLNIKKEKIIW
ncbi:MAG: uracil-DNA glycosylase [Mycoplasmoidaceae bacterium]